LAGDLTFVCSDNFCPAQGTVSTKGTDKVATIPRGTELRVEKFRVQTPGLRSTKNNPFGLVLSVENEEFWLHFATVNQIDIKDPKVKLDKPFFLQNRYQDDRWTNIDNEDFKTFEEAVARAASLCQNAITYGMVRVCQIYEGPGDDRTSVLVTFPAGGFIK